MRGMNCLRISRHQPADASATCESSVEHVATQARRDWEAHCRRQAVLHLTQATCWLDAIDEAHRHDCP